MNENYTRRRPRLEDAKEKNDEVRQGGFFFTGFQIVVCIICLVAALALKQFGEQYYVTAKSYVKDALQNSITSEEVSEVLHNIGKQLPDAAEVFSSGVTSSSNSQKNAQSSSPSKAVNSSSATSKPAVSSTPSASAKSASSSALSTSTLTTSPLSKLTSVKVTAAAVNTVADGENMPKIDTDISACASQLPPASASLAPFRLSIKPVMPVSGRITSAYGYRVNPVTGKYTFHTGIDIAAARSTPIAAAFAGTVEEVGKSDTYGNYVILDSNGAIKTFYGHCETVTVKPGDKVKAGETIAKVGSTGISTGYHLHFEMRVNSIYENPQWVI